MIKVDPAAHMRCASCNNPGALVVQITNDIGGPFKTFCICGSCSGNLIKQLDKLEGGDGMTRDTDKDAALLSNEAREHIKQAIWALEHYIDCDLEDEDRENTQKALDFFCNIAYA